MALVLLVVLAGFCEVITAPMQAHENVLHVTVVWCQPLPAQVRMA
jgi:hypothetical protein